MAIEEVLGRLPRGERMENNPYFCAGYLHIDCLETLIDIGQLIRAGMLRPKPREYHDKEPNTSKTEPQVLCPPAKLVTCFEEFCKRVVQAHWDGYLHNLADRLQTYVWLSVQKKGKWSTHDAPSEMTKEDAQELLRRRPVDPNWGGGRRPGLPMKTVKKAEAGGKRRFLVGPGTGRNSEKAKKTASKIIQEFEGQLPEDQFEDGSSWLQDCYIELTGKEMDASMSKLSLSSPTEPQSQRSSNRGPKRQRREYVGQPTRSDVHLPIYDQPTYQPVLHHNLLALAQQSPAATHTFYQGQHQYQGFTNDVGAYFSESESYYPPISTHEVPQGHGFQFDFSCPPPGNTLACLDGDFIDPQLVNGSEDERLPPSLEEDDLLSELLANV